MLGVILAEKKESAQRFSEDGIRIPVTNLSCDDCYLVDIITDEKRGYTAVKIGFGKVKRTAKPVAGELKKAGINTPLKHLREFRMNKDDIEVIEEEGKVGMKQGEQTYFIGDKLLPTAVFAVGDIIHVTGTTKGKGFQGVVRRHGFAGGPATHGQSNRLRAPGSMGSGTTPGRIFKGKREAGRVGALRVTIQKLQVVEVNENNVIVKGLVPGNKNSLMEIRKAS